MQVELVPRRLIDHLAEPELWDVGHPSTVSGMTISVGDQVLRLTVVEGLPLMRFGAVVAHEAMHAWMAQRGFSEDLATPLREGLCQLTAFSWLRRQTDPRAALIREAMERDPDPDYGDGFRTVRDAVLRKGLQPVLAALRSHGRLP
ncbi:MAG TPA: protein DA1 [Kribbellaceae bacterium]|nr:protein DA1 [Kribbellaceae bacterium]